MTKKAKANLFAALILLLLASFAHAEDEGKETYWVGVRPGGRPYLFADTLDDKTKLRGFVVDLLALGEKVIGCKFNYIICENMVERRELLLKKSIDLIMLDSPSFSNHPDLHHIPLGISLERRLYVHESCRDVTCTEDLAHHRIAVIAGDNYVPFLKRAGQESISVVNNPEEALKMLDKGQVDVFLAPSQRNADSIITQLGMQNVVRVGTVLEEIPLCITVRADDHILRGKITQALSVLHHKGVLKALEEKWLGAHLEPSHWKTYFQWILVGIAGVMLAALVVVGINHQLKQKVRAITRDLRSSEEKYRELIESSPEMILVLDRDGVIRHANVVATQVLSANGAGLLDRPLAQWTTGDEREKLRGFLDEVFQGPKGEIELHLHDAKGGIREVDIAASRIMGQAEGALVCCFARDVTQRNSLERELIQSERLATIGKIAAGVAHEINNPIGIVRANVELLLERGMYNPETREFLESILRNSIRAGKITHELLTAARPAPPRMEPVDLERVIDLSLGMLGQQLKGIEVRRIPPERPMRILGDSSLLQQVVINLLLNAKAGMNASQDRRITIQFCPHSGEEAVRLRIEDTGKGIPKSLLNEIFEPFFTQGKQEGFGLGLFIARRVIERHGGLIFAESEEGRGAAIIIELPALAESDGALAQAEDDRLGTQAPGPGAKTPDFFSKSPARPWGGFVKDRLLIVDDEADFLHVLRSHFTFDDYEVFTADCGEAALAFLGQSTVDAVVCDMAMPGMSGLDLLKEIRMMDAFLPVIIMTGVGTIESAVEAIKLGAFHYVTKPFDTQDLKLLVKRAIENGRLHRRLAGKEQEDRVQGNLVVGSSRAIQDIMHTVDKVAGSDVSILILGETGTGKSALARLIHEKSPRKNQPFLTIDCAALADNLLESELFGHVKGAFTGAIAAKRGLLEEAQGGTVFLDEIGEMPPSTQVKLLRAVQELEVKPVGGNHSVKIDVRIVSATSRDIQHEIREGRFREELFFRLAVITLRLPALRERKNDLLLFVDHFVAKFNRKYKKNVTRIDPLVVTLLLAAPWRGNIRELENTIERAVLLAEAETLTAENLCLVGPASEADPGRGQSLSLRSVVEEAEKTIISQTLADTGGNRSEAAKRLGIGRRTLYDKMSAYGLE